LVTINLTIINQEEEEERKKKRKLYIRNRVNINIRINICEVFEMRRDASYIKVERLALITKKIAKQFPEPVDFHKLVLWIEMEIGLSGEKACEYVEKVCEVHDWEIEDGKISPAPV